MKLGKTKAFKERKRGVLMEDLDGKLDQVLEGYGALDAKIDKHHEEFREFVLETGEKFRFIGESINERFGLVDKKFDIVFAELRELKGQRVA